MPIKRKVCRFGNAFAIFLPKSWVELLEEKHGRIEHVAIEVDEILTIAPIIPKNSHIGNQPCDATRTS